MNNAKHTPGPWTIEDPFTEDLAIVRGGLKSYEWSIIATVSTDEGGNDPIPLQIRDANARLIAAAPDLLLALTSLREFVASLQWGQKFPGRPHAEMDAADRAIEQATRVNS